MMTLEPWQWVLAVIGALAIGLAKTGINGLGMLAVVIFANLLPAREASGFVLPMLVFADVIAVASYRRHAQWSYLWKLFPFAALGVGIGAFTLRRIDDREAKVMIGAIVLTLLVVHLVRRTRAPKEVPAHGWWYAALFGVLAGFTTLVANAAGPLMAIYLLSMRLPKMEYMGTGAYYFLLMNLFKVPFMIKLGLIDAQSFKGNLVLLPAVIVGALVGRVILKKIDQRLFENLALGLSAAAGLRLLF